MSQNSQNNGNCTPPLKNMTEPSHLQRYEALLEQERNLREEYETLLRSQPTQEQMQAEIRAHEKEYEELCEAEKGHLAEIAEAREKVENSRGKAEIAKALLESEEELYQKSYSECMRRSKEIDAEASHMEQEFARVSAELKDQYENLMKEVNSKEIEVQRLEEECRKAEVAKAKDEAMQAEIIEAQQQITQERAQINELEKEKQQLKQVSDEHDRQIAETEHQLSAIRSQLGHEKRTFDAYRAIFKELEALAINANSAEAQYAEAQEALQGLEKILQDAYDADTQASVV